MQTHAVDVLGRDGVHVAVGVLPGLEDGGVEPVGVLERLELRVHIGELAVLDERPGVRERHLEHIGQRAASELSSEGGRLPFVLFRHYINVRVQRLELGHLLVEAAIASSEEPGSSETTRSSTLPPSPPVPSVLPVSPSPELQAARMLLNARIPAVARTPARCVDFIVTPSGWVGR